MNNTHLFARKTVCPTCGSRSALTQTLSYWFGVPAAPLVEVTP
jgi:hypothetical protein